MKIEVFYVACLSMMCSLFSGCMDSDPLSLSKKRVIGDYYLDKSEGGIYYLLRTGHDDDGGGVIEGTVQQIGWSNSTIVAKRVSTFGGDPDGWMIIDTKSHKISGPFSEQEKDTKFGSNTCYTAEVAWKKL